MSPEFESRLAVFICNNYIQHTGRKLKRDIRTCFPLDIRIVKVACSNWLEPEILLEPILANFDGVLIFACLPGDCPYSVSDDYISKRFQEVVSLLHAVNISEGRVYLHRIPVGQERGLDIHSTVKKMAKRVKDLGSLHLNKAVREKLRIAQNNFEARRIRKMVVTGLIQVSTNRRSQPAKAVFHDEYIKSWLSVLMEETPLTLEHMSEAIDIEVEHISEYLLILEKECRIHIPAELKQQMVVGRTSDICRK